MPSAGVDIIRSQLQALASQDQQALGIGLLAGLAIALWSANNGIKAPFEAINIAHEETEKRGFVKLNLVSLAFTLGALLIAIGLITRKTH